jgi:hypothetical protein
MENEGLIPLETEDVSFAMALRHYLTNGTTGQATSLDDIKPIILDKQNRNAYVAELVGYGYKIKVA